MRTPALAYGAAIAYLTGLWLQILHYAEHASERNEPPLLVHWLRDSTLSLPLCVLGAAAGLWIAARLAEQHGRDAWLEPVAVAGACSAFLMAAQPLHGALFEAHHAHEINPVVHAVRDGLFAFGGSLPVAAAVLALRGRALLRGALPRAMATAAVAIAPGCVLVASVGATAPSTARLPCPAS